ncbi:MAG: hypothetical protein KA319_12495 [Ferruginibacter sp.]|nr:hypothetical protein [Ferruginibacter sp.]
MHKLIATYLFQHKQCPLPGLGHLYVLQIPAINNFINKQIIAPQWVVKFSATQIDDENFLNYAAKINNTNSSSIKQQLQNLFTQNNISIHGVGEFKNENGKFDFVAEEINPLFSQPTNADRVVHENEAHTMVVGDTETTTTAMTEYFADDEVKKDYWWVWALVIAGISIAAICMYFFAGIN